MAKRTVEERFWAKVDRDGPVPDYAPHLGPCWLWTGTTTPEGYGRFNVGQARMAQAHRFSYEHLVGAIPEGLQIDHLCRVRYCVNPDHLEAVTQRENALRGGGITARCAVKTHCDRGHPFDAVNTYVDPRGRRRCRICARISHNHYRSQRRLDRMAETLRAAGYHVQAPVALYDKAPEP